VFMSEKQNDQPRWQIADLIALLFSNCQEKEARFVARYSITVVEFRCMRIINQYPQLTVNHLASEMALTSSRITRIIDGLVSKKIVSREIGKTDRRYFELRLTAKGKKMIQQLNQEYTEMHEEILSNIPEKYQESMYQGIIQLNNAIEKWLNKV